MHEIITHGSTDQMLWIQVVQHLRQWHLSVLTKVVEIALWLGPALPKATYQRSFSKPRLPGTSLGG